MTNINPYLSFDGNAEEALTFYKSVFGGEFMGGVMRWGEVPGCDEGEMKLSEEDKGKVMHMALPISDGNVIMASDSLKSMGPPLTAGNNVTIAIGPETRQKPIGSSTVCRRKGKFKCRWPMPFGADTSAALKINLASTG
jgi:PhnB protein